ncbi:TIGR02234 family membrane protein [Actinomadura rudentiformis]|uniref:TIGR02234 family membrane protein n=1 Tax=Actinomadura rudentiformis TaxID=359158 RepID=A0A6H9YED6_9ACTN|nr:TIGR02234 family membrane protein [Actinomadura rudentiformis]KAB2342745.1 TIGR02234 family membrane protein [Actinomadura rudentiformis]
MTPAGRERGLTALLCAAGAGLVLLAAGRPWATVRARDAITPFVQELTGRDLGGAASALGWAGLAALAALFATRGRVRAGVGLLLVIFGAGIGYASVAAVRRSHVLTAAGDERALLQGLSAHPAVETGPWWMVSVAGAVLLAAAGLITVVRGARWPGMSARYERQGPAGRPAGAPERAAGERTAADDSLPVDQHSLWKSLDRGEDPTAAEERRP